TNALFTWTVSDATAAEFAVPGVYANKLAAYGVRTNFTVTATSAWGHTTSATVSTSSTHTLVYDAFTGTDGTPVTAHPPDIDTLVTACTVGAVSTEQMRSHRAPVTQSGTNGIALVRIETGATDGVIGIDWSAADQGSTISGVPKGLIAFRVQDASNYLYAG